jgi:hypothetical protein
MGRRITARLNDAASLVRLSNCFSPASAPTQIRSHFLLDTSLSTSPISKNSTRHSVTSRIHRNSRPLSYLIFSTRQLNATPEKRKNVEKFNTRFRFFAASGSFPKMEISPHLTARKNSHDRSRTTRVGLQ